MTPANVFHAFTRALPFYSTFRMAFEWNKTLFLPKPPESRDEEREKALKEKFASIISQHGIRQDLQFREQPDGGVCASHGANFFGKEAGIVVSPGFEEADEDAFNGIVKHEFAHILFNDLFTIPLVGTIAGLAVAILLPYCFTMSVLASTGVYMTANVVSALSFALFSQYRKQKPMIGRLLIRQTPRSKGSYAS